MENEKEVRKYIGSKIKEYRKKKKISQDELGKKIGVKNNTISAYERGVIALDSDTIFRLSDVLEINPNELFPPIKNEQNNFLDKLQSLSASNLQLKDMMFLQELIEKTLSMDETEREKFLESIRFTVDYYQKMNNNN